MQRILYVLVQCLFCILRIKFTAAFGSSSLQKVGNVSSASAYYAIYKTRRQLTETIKQEETTSNRKSSLLLSPINARSDLYVWTGDVHHFTYRIKLKENERLDKLTLYFKQPVNRTRASHSCNVMIKVNNTRLFKASIDLKSSYNNWLKLRLQKGLIRKLNHYTKSSDSLDINLRLKFRQPVHFSGIPYLSLSKLQRQAPQMLSDVTKKHKAPKCVGQCCLRHLELDFEKLGWHWVIYPKKIVVNYCGGSCDLDHMTPYERGQLPAYTRTLQAMLDKLEENQSSMSCIADKWTSHMMLYRDFDGSVKSSHDSIRRIESCQCV